jgi:hypothetical protein
MVPMVSMVLSAHKDRREYREIPDRKDHKATQPQISLPTWFKTLPLVS